MADSRAVLSAVGGRWCALSIVSNVGVLLPMVRTVGACVTLTRLTLKSAKVDIVVIVWNSRVQTHLGHFGFQTAAVVVFVADSLLGQESSSVALFFHLQVHFFQLLSNVGHLIGHAVGWRNSHDLCGAKQNVLASGVSLAVVGASAFWNASKGCTVHVPSRTEHGKLTLEGLPIDVWASREIHIFASGPSHPLLDLGRASVSLFLQALFSCGWHDE